jgi:TP901 family phage tail tape measure protein
MASIGDIVATLRMDNTNFSRGAKQSQTQAKGLGSALGKMGTAAKVAGAAFIALQAAKLAGRGINALVGSAADLDTALQKSFAIQKLSTDQQYAMREAAIAVAGDVSASTAQVAEGFFFLASAGLNAEQQIAALPQVAAFAQAGMFDMATATDLATDAQSAMGLTSNDAAANLAGLVKVTDTLVGANTLANASVEQFSKALTSGAGAAARDVGMSIEGVTAVLAVFADQGIKAENAGTQFSIVMRDLQTKAIQNKEAFAAAGVGVFDASGEMRNMALIVGDLENRLAGLGDEQRKATLLALGFSDKSVGALQKLLGTSDKIAEYERKLASMGGVTQDVAANSMTAFDKSLNKLSKSWDKLKTRVGTPLIELLLPVIDTAISALDGMTQSVVALFEAAGVEVGPPPQRVDETITSEWNERIKAEEEAAKAAEEGAKKRKAAEEAAAAAAAQAAEEAKKQADAQAGLNQEVERFSQLTSAAADAGSVEAYTRIFDTIARGAQPDVQSPAQNAVAMVKNAGGVGAVGGPGAPVVNGQQVAVLNGILTELRRNTAATKKIVDEAEEI